MSRTETPVTVPARAEPRSALRVVTALSATAALFAMLMLAAVLQGIPQFAPPTPQPRERPAEDTVIPEITGSPPPAIDPPEDTLLMRILGIVFGVLLAAVVLALLVVVLRWVIRRLKELWRDRPGIRRPVTAATVELVGDSIEAEPDEAVIRRGASDALREIQEGADPGDAIVAAWLELERSAQDAGSGRALSETPAEFTVRIIGRRSGIAADVRTLLGLYERVRFGGMPADETDRATAAASVQRIRAGWR